MSIYSTEARFGDYTPTDFGWGARDPEQDPTLLTPFAFAGVDFGSMHVDAVGVFTAVLTDLVPLIPGGLVAGQCGCYNPGSVTVGGARSFHTYGIAIDVNWGENPMGAASMPTGPHALPAATSSVAKSWGCEWGGDWTYPQDWMHIEVHLTPDQARAVTGPTAVPIPSEEDDMANYPYIIFDASNPSSAALVDVGGVSLIRGGQAVTGYRNALKVPSVPLDSATFKARIKGAN